MKNRKWLTALVLLLCAGLFHMGGAMAHDEMVPHEPGKDEKCAYCMMVVYPREHEMGKFTAQMLTAEGKRLFFDDIGCMLNYKRGMSQEPKKMWVRDYHSLDWVEYNKAHVVSANIETPMGYGFAFFANQADSEKFVTNHKNLEAVKTDMAFVNALAQKRMEAKMNHGGGSTGHGGNMNHGGNMHQNGHGMHHAPQKITVIVNGKPLSLAQAPVIENERVLVPLRGVLESMGAKVAWNQQAKRATITKGGTVIEVTLNAKQAKVGKNLVNLDVPARLMNGHTMVPLRFVGEALGAEVQWDGAKREVTVRSK